MQRFFGKDISKYARPIVADISKTYGSNSIVDVFEDLTHDGYDNLGPQSDLWYLYLVIQLTSGKYLHRRYHAERWYRDGPVDDCRYYLSAETTADTDEQQLSLLF